MEQGREELTVIAIILGRDAGGVSEAQRVHGFPSKTTGQARGNFKVQIRSTLVHSIRLDLPGTIEREKLLKGLMRIER
jgi:hypothetical protein